MLTHHGGARQLGDRRGGPRGSPLVHGERDKIRLLPRSIVVDGPFAASGEELDRRETLNPKLAARLPVLVAVDGGDDHLTTELGRDVLPLRRELLAVPAPGSIELQEQR